MRVLFLVLLLVVFSCAPKQEDTKSQWQYYYDLGMSSYIAKNYSEAIANFFKATQLAPQEPKVWNALGLAYMEVQEYQKAENAFLRSLQVDRTYTEAKMNLGILYYKQRDYEKALKTLQEVTEDESFSQKHLAFYFLAKVYQAMDRREDYLRNLRRAVAYNPMFLDAQLELAQFYEGEEDYASAKEVYQRLINNGMGNPSIYLSLAGVEYRLGEYSSAKEYIRKVLEDKQVTPQLKSRAYDLLSQVLIAEQRRVFTPPPIERRDTMQSIPPTLPEKTVTEPPEGSKAPQAMEKKEAPRGMPPAPSNEPVVEKPTVNKFYRIQLGAFSSASSAKAWRDKLERDLNLKDVMVVESSGVFKVLYGRFENREEAIKQLERLKGMNLYGFIVYE